MSLKKTDLAKNLGLKISSQMKRSGPPGRYGAASDAVPDKREQRKLDQAAGLVPFAVKLHGDLVKQLQDRAQQQGVHLNVLVDGLLRTALSAGEAPETPPAPKEAAAKTAAVKTATAKKAPAKKASATKASATKTSATKSSAKNT